MLCGTARRTRLKNALREWLSTNTIRARYPASNTLNNFHGSDVEILCTLNTPYFAARQVGYWSVSALAYPKSVEI